jgi:hypothetical protein
MKVFVEPLYHPEDVPSAQTESEGRTGSEGSLEGLPRKLAHLRWPRSISVAKVGIDSPRGRGARLMRKVRAAERATVRVFCDLVSVAHRGNREEGPSREPSVAASNQDRKLGRPLRRYGGSRWEAQKRIGVYTRNRNGRRFHSRSGPESGERGYAAKWGECRSAGTVAELARGVEASRLESVSEAQLCTLSTIIPRTRTILMSPVASLMGLL